MKKARSVSVVVFLLSASLLAFLIVPAPLSKAASPNGPSYCGYKGYLGNNAV